MTVNLIRFLARMQGREAIQVWLKYAERRYAPQTAAHYRATIWKFADAMPNKLHHITREHIENYLASLPFSNRGVNCHLICIKSFFHYCNEHFGLKNPAEKIKKLPESEPHQNIITEVEYELILKACNTKEKMVIELLYSTGLRAGEAPQALVPSNIRGSMLYLIGKGNRPRCISLNSTALKAIDILISMNLSKNLERRNAIYNTCKRVSKKSGVHFSPHSLRHFFADSLRKKGVPIYTISKLLGHSHIRTTETYLHCSEYELKGVTDILDKPAENG